MFIFDVTSDLLFVGLYFGREAASITPRASGDMKSDRGFWGR